MSEDLSLKGVLDFHANKSKWKLDRHNEKFLLCLKASFSCGINFLRIGIHQTRYVISECTSVSFEFDAEMRHCLFCFVAKEHRNFETLFEVIRSIVMRCRLKSYLQITML